MRRPIQPYVSILQLFLSGRIDVLEFRTRTIDQFDRLDARVDWVTEWSPAVNATLVQMDADAEVYYPEAPESSYITIEELRASCVRNLERLLAAQRALGR